MGKVVISTQVSLDGVMENPHHFVFDYFNEEVGGYAVETLFGSEAVLMGRATYEGFLEAWPGRTDEAGYADRMNSMPKYVASTTLKSVEWNNTSRIEGDVAAAVAKLKAESDGNILKFGGGRLMRTLMDANLADELHLLVFPVVLGAGQRIFEGGFDTKFRLMESKGFSTGVVLLKYAPVKVEG